MQTTRLMCLVSLLALFTAPAGGETCQKEFDSTFEMIQSEIFEKRGCTNQLCHGASAAGGLDLRTDVAFDNLVDAPIGSLPAETQRQGLKRVVPGHKDLSLLWLNLASATIPELWEAPLR